MADESGPIVVDETVTERATPDLEPDTVSVADAPRELVILSDEELARVAAEAASVEGRLKLAKPHWVRAWNSHVMVAPARGLSMYRRLFSGEMVAPEGKEVGDDDEPRLDDALMRELILNCVVKPKVTEEMVTGLCDGNAADFFSLGSKCMSVTSEDASEAFAEIMDVLPTEAKERFFVERAGSTN